MCACVCQKIDAETVSCFQFLSKEGCTDNTRQQYMSHKNGLTFKQTTKTTTRQSKNQSDWCLWLLCTHWFTYIDVQFEVCQVNDHASDWINLKVRFHSLLFEYSYIAGKST